MTCGGSSSTTSSRASAAGRSRSISPAGPATDLFGRPAVPARRSAPPERPEDVRAAKAATLCGALDELASQYARLAATHGLPTPATYGRRSGGSQPSAGLNGFSGSRLRSLAERHGSPLYALRWKSSDTLLALDDFRLAASARPISANDDSLLPAGWPTPMAGTPAQKGYNEAGNTDSGRRTVALAAGWPTPKLSDQNGTRAPDGKRGMGLNDVAGWATPSARDWKDTPGMATLATNPDGSKRRRTDQLARQAALAGWATPRVGNGGFGHPKRANQPGSRLEDQVHGAMPSGSPAATEKPGQLNPAHSRWLMGFPPAWDGCAPTETRSSRSSRRRSSATK